MYACICRGITEAQVRRAGGAGVLNAGELIVVLGLDDEACCGRCVEDVDGFVSLAIEGATMSFCPAERLTAVPAGVA